MMLLADVLSEYPDRLWHWDRQVGVTHAVGRVPTRDNGEPSYDYKDLRAMKMRFEEFGFKLEVIEPGLNAQMHEAKLGIDGRDQQIEFCKTLIRNMAALEIPVLCYNFMAKFNWIRTAVNTPARGGALVTSYKHDLIKDAPLTDVGMVSKEKLWDNLTYFLEQIVPVAEDARVKLALHPDDPPVSPIRGISRIITSAEAIKKAINLVPSEYSGITMCQGSLSAAGENIPKLIREMAGKIFFVHFRDVKGTKEDFCETFHDDGQTDMFEAIKAYREIGYNGPIRIDHVPTMYGEQNDEPGYGEIGRLFALGYLKGLIESREKIDHVAIKDNRPPSALKDY
ncbi:MAG: mannonate dehydratase [Sphingobacteriales bacterium]|nr:mannonate dehydratase [Sphingobacteriales bacterium]